MPASGDGLGTAWKECRATVLDTGTRWCWAVPQHGPYREYVWIQPLVCGCLLHGRRISQAGRGAHWEVRGHRSGSSLNEKSLREDLYKKHMTGEPLACRPNNALLTRLILFIGWKIFEMNQSLTFQGVTEETFPSMMRRTLVILLMADSYLRTCSPRCPSVVATPLHMGISRRTTS